MAFKHQTESFRDGGKWICWCDGHSIEHAKAITADIKEQGFAAKREKNRVFVQPNDMVKIDSKFEELM